MFGGGHIVPDPPVFNIVEYKKFPLQRCRALVYVSQNDNVR